MQDLYIYSKSDLKVTVIRNYKKKFLIGVSTLLIVLLFILFGPSGILYKYDIIHVTEPTDAKITELTNKYNAARKELDSLISLNNQLRESANLPEVTLDERKLIVNKHVYAGVLSFSGGSLFGAIDEVSKLADDLQSKLNYQKSVQSNIANALSANLKIAETMPSINPVIDGGFSPDSYGVRKNPVYGVVEFHKGLDITAPEGTPIHAAGSGTVERAGYNGGFGIEVTLDHGNGYKTIYAHLSMPKVIVGQKVRRGFVVGLAGNTGLSTNAHLHYEVLYKGENKNPSDYIFK